jgi:hypothetical protein
MQRYKVSFDLVLANDAKMPSSWIANAIYDNLDVNAGECYLNLSCHEATSEDVETESDKKLMAYIDKLIEAGVLTKSERQLDSYYYWINEESYTLKHKGDTVVQFELHEGTIITNVRQGNDDIELYDVLVKDLSIMQHHHVTVEELLN